MKGRERDKSCGNNTEAQTNINRKKRNEKIAVVSWVTRLEHKQLSEKKRERERARERVCNAAAEHNEKLLHTVASIKIEPA